MTETENSSLDAHEVVRPEKRSMGAAAQNILVLILFSLSVALIVFLGMIFIAAAHNGLSSPFLLVVLLICATLLLLHFLCIKRFKTRLKYILFPSGLILSLWCFLSLIMIPQIIW